MKSSNLAQCLEEFEATLESLRLTNEPETRQVVGQDAPFAAPEKTLRRHTRTGGIQIRDQGLRPFRVF
jgi:hypothetical protein